VLGGDFMPSEKLSKWMQSADGVWAADGGYLLAEAAGRTPDLTVGDLDSIPTDVIARIENVIHDRDQSTTDCEKLLNLAQSRGYEAITLICSEGDLLDHQLGAIQAAVKSSLRVRFALVRGIAWVVKGHVEQEFMAKAGCRVSLLPITKVTGVELAGVEWEINDADLAPDGLNSISNKAMKNRVTLKQTSGASFLFIESEGCDWD
jgi:thiamine pyrophosphokinase